MFDWYIKADDIVLTKDSSSFKAQPQAKKEPTQDKSWLGRKEAFMKQRGKRIRPSGKDLVFHFTIASLLPVFPAGCRTVSCEDNPADELAGFNLSQADKIDIPYFVAQFRCRDYLLAGIVVYLNGFHCMVGLNNLPH